MKSLITTSLAAAALPAVAALAAVPAPPVAAANPSPAWKAALEQYAATHLDHPSWGVAHARRDYRVALDLARRERVPVDEEALFAAAYLHDIGAIEGFARPEVEHMARALELIDPILAEAGFPGEKVPLVRTIVGHHMYFSDPAGLPVEAVLFRDADTLDFLGAIGVARIFALTGRHRWAPTIDAAEETVRKNAAELPAKLVTRSAREMARERVSRMEAFLDELAGER